MSFEEEVKKNPYATPPNGIAQCDCSCPCDVLNRVGVVSVCLFLILMLPLFLFAIIDMTVQCQLSMWLADLIKESRK